MKKMNHIILVMLSAFLSVNTSVVLAQKSFTEGKIVYEISFPEGDVDEQTKAMMPSESVVFVKGSMSRTDLSMAMGFSSSSIYNGKTGQNITLTDVMGNKTYMTMDADKEAAKQDKPTFEHSGESKTIAGYFCKKSIMKMKDGSSMELFHTDKISSSMSGALGGKDLGGFPLEYTLDQMGIKMRFTAKTITPEKVSDDMFKVPSGYKFVTLEEMQKMYGGGN